MMQESLGRRLRVLRAKRGLSLRQAAKEAGVVKETISDIERGTTHPYDVTLAKLARVYGVPVEELLEDVEPSVASGGRLGEASASPKVQAPPSRRSSQADHAEEWRERLDEIREEYRPIREGLARFCDRWERRLTDGNDVLDIKDVEHFFEAAEPLVPAAMEAALGEYLQIAQVLDIEVGSGITDEMRAEASLAPLASRYNALVRKVWALGEERFSGEDVSTAATVVHLRPRLEESEQKLRELAG